MAEFQNAIRDAPRAIPGYHGHTSDGKGEITSPAGRALKPDRNGRYFVRKDDGYRTRVHGDILIRLALGTPPRFPVEMRPIVGGNGKYHAGVDGKIYSVHRDGTVSSLEGTLRSGRTDGCRQVTLSKGRTTSISLLVLSAFSGPMPSPGCVPVHADGSAANCSPDNLSWGRGHCALRSATGKFVARDSSAGGPT
jgi:hypothetical protein